VNCQSQVPYASYKVPIADVLPVTSTHHTVNAAEQAGYLNKLHCHCTQQKIM